MALQPPVAVASGFPFGGYNIWEPSCYHAGATTCAFYSYAGSVRADHFHMGLDFPAAIGTPIHASEAGVVTYAGWAANPGPEAGGGLVIEIKIAGGMYYLSAHCASLNVSVGTKVARGQQIATVGATGTVTGPHDHYQCFTVDGYGNRMFYNPALFLPGGAWQSDPRIQTQHYSLKFSPYAAPRVAMIAKGTTVQRWDPNHPGGPVLPSYTAPATRGSSFSVIGKTTVSWTPSPGPVPRGTFLQGAHDTSGGFFRNYLVLMGQVKAKDGQPW